MENVLDYDAVVKAQTEFLDTAGWTSRHVTRACLLCIIYHMWYPTYYKSVREVFNAAQME